MGKTLVVYFSRTGNTRKVAEAIYNALDGDRSLQTISEPADLNAYDLVFIGFPIQAHSVPYPVEQYLKALPKGKKIALFSTHGSFPHHQMAVEALEHAAVLTGHCHLLGTFHCRGKVSLQALEAFARSPEHLEWSEMAPSSASHPDAHDLAEAAAFARHMKARSAEAGSPFYG